jgi:tripartite-type tricarboxylate transporter receptor subunit TctC
VIAKALRSDELRKRFDDMGLVAKAGSPEEFGPFLLSEMNRWKGALAKMP